MARSSGQRDRTRLRELILNCLSPWTPTLYVMYVNFGVKPPFWPCPSSGANKAFLDGHSEYQRKT